jgi:hypothetical protein
MHAESAFIVTQGRTEQVSLTLGWFLHIMISSIYTDW